MCEHDCHLDVDAAPADGPSRRQVLGRLAAVPVLTGAAVIGSAAPSAASPPLPALGRRRTVAPMPPVIRRSEWGPDLAVTGAVPAEEPRFLLVHHTSQPGSDYEPDGVVRLLRGIHSFHIGAAKGWPDIAYNFFVDKFGRIYEGRAGSAERPLRGSATGGNQGYSQLCCFLGDFNTSPPPPPALDAMYSLLAWLADRYAIETSPGATTTFTSLGSNRWPAGAAVTTPTIAAHRDMSQTSCPGDACYSLVRSTFPAEVAARRGAVVIPAAPPTPAPTTSEPATTTTTTIEPTTTTTTVPTTTTTEMTATSAAPTTSIAERPVRARGEEAAAAPPAEASSDPAIPIGAGAALAALVGGGIYVLRTRRT